MAEPEGTGAAAVAVPGPWGGYFILHPPWPLNIVAKWEAAMYQTHTRLWKPQPRRRMIKRVQDRQRLTAPGTWGWASHFLMSKTEISENLCLQEKHCASAPHSQASVIPKNPWQNGDSMSPAHKSGRVCGVNLTLGFNSDSLGLWKKRQAAGLGNNRDGLLSGTFHVVGPDLGGWSSWPWTENKMLKIVMRVLPVFVVSPRTWHVLRVYETRPGTLRTMALAGS